MAIITFTAYNEEGEGVLRALPARWEICFRCQGEGSVDAWEGGMTSEEFQEQGPEFAADYLSGMYSRSCPECRGDGKVKVADEDRFTEGDQKFFEEYLSEQSAAAEYAAEVAAEQRMGA